jgi:ribosomal protein S18 acetylase RimI-like enzyme
MLCWRIPQRQNNYMADPLNKEQRAFLRNPFYAALTTLQSDFAEHMGNGVLRYRPEVLPFAAVAEACTVVDAAMMRGDTDTNFTGAIPEIAADTPDALYASCLQMAWLPRKGFTVPEPMPGEAELSSSDAAAMLELTSVAFPKYFRAETYRLGRYIGIRVDGQLVAMAGHRTRMPGLREISALCTRPGFTGRGYAQHLLQRLLADTPGELPYLHVLSNNTRAITIYDSLGFIRLGEVPFLHIPKRG